MSKPFQNVYKLSKSFEYFSFPLLFSSVFFFVFLFFSVDF